MTAWEYFKHFKLNIIGICRMISQPGSSGEWTVYMNFDEGANMDQVSNLFLYILLYNFQKPIWAIVIDLHLLSFALRNHWSKQD